MTARTTYVARFVLILILLSDSAIWAAGPEETEFFALYKKGGELYRQGNYQQAIPYYERAAMLSLKVFGSYHANTANIAEDLGIAYKNLGNFEDAIGMQKICLQVRERILPKNDVKLAWTNNNLGRIYEAMGKLDTAEPYYLKSVAIAEGRGKNDAEVATPLQNLGNIYYVLGQYSRAEPLYQRSLAIREATLGKDHHDVALSLQALAILHSQLGHYVQAEAFYRRSLMIFETKQGPEHPNVAMGLHNLGNLYFDMGLYEKAETVWRRSLAIREKQLGGNHTDVAKSLNVLANFYKYTQQPDKAEPLYLRSAAILESALGKDSSDIAIPIENLGQLYVDRREYAKAEPLVLRGLALREAALGKDHPDAAYPLHSLADLYLRQNDAARAEPLLRRALSIRETKLGQYHPELFADFNLSGILYTVQQRWSEAGDVFERQRRAVRRHVVEILPTLSPGEQLTFLNRMDRDMLQTTLTFAWQRRETPEIAETSASWLVNGKAVAHEALAERALLERDLADPRLQAVASQLRDIRQRHAALAMSSPKAGEEAERTRQLAQLATQQQSLEDQLVQAKGQTRARGAAWVELSEVRSALPADSVLVDIAHFRPRDFAAHGEEQWQAARYVAWIVPPTGERQVKIVDLGAADTIDAAVQALRSALQQGPGLIADEGEAAAEQSLQQPLMQLAKLALHPILAELTDARQIILCLDGALWLVPWSALPLADGRYAIEAHQVRCVVSGRDLLANRRDPIGTSAPIIVADPNYDLGPKEALAATQAVLRAAQTPSIALRSLEPATSSSGLPKVPRLPGTAEEAKAITPKLQAYLGAAPLVYTDQWALEVYQPEYASSAGLYRLAA